MRLVSLTYLPELPQRERVRAGGECLAESRHTESAVLALSLSVICCYSLSRGVTCVLCSSIWLTVATRRAAFTYIFNSINLK